MIVVVVVGGTLIVITTSKGQAPGKYGGVSIPGKGVLQLPKGKVIISFSVFTGGGTANGSSVAVPNDLGVTIYPVNPRVPPAPIHDKTGSVQPDGDYMTAPVWSVEVPQSAAYHVVAKGSANTGYPNSKLIFGVEETPIGILAMMVGITLALLLLIGFGPRLIARMRRA